MLHDTANRPRSEDKGVHRFSGRPAGKSTHRQYSSSVPPKWLLNPVLAAVWYSPRQVDSEIISSFEGIIKVLNKQDVWDNRALLLLIDLQIMSYIRNPNDLYPRLNQRRNQNLCKSLSLAI